ncbi:NTP transferase domain-containing protein [Bifidobacterium xylocopae]|uniref:MarR family transcriptional regulator n=1 Tax=Bifidobacterium xylocopae TaxID=2493119 RepID=A0A366KB99_9BIFI|nr:NTP transferase domain-containing protein [Bifidobacterium xylocopae]RBP99006.1 MarR family transcriptional regulator [Bifidobacterium xylocopae]
MNIIEVALLVKKQFLTLKALYNNSNSTQRELASITGLSLGSVNSAVRSLRACHYIADGTVTEEGVEALQPYKVCNAVILAAGLSSRFAPISYEKPKGLLCVRGDVLIERQIEQLQRAGIKDITVVVGYKKEQFFYLQKKYGVSIVVNDEYVLRNNNSSLWAVRDRLSNTYVCSSDDYFASNPFEKYVWKAYYAAQYAAGPTKEWCLTADSEGRITDVNIGGSDSWYMLGHAYFDRAFSRSFIHILADEYDSPETADELWEGIYKKHLNVLDMDLKPYQDGIINEFDSLDELEGFDPHFLQNVDSEIFDNIMSVLGCGKDEIREMYPLKQGLTNLSCHFATDKGEFVYRHPGDGTDRIIDRAEEVKVQKIASKLHLDKTFIYEDPLKGWKISAFIPNCKNLDPHNEAQIQEAMKMARKLHDSGESINRVFNFYDEAKNYERLLRECGPIEIKGYGGMAQKVERLEQFVERDNAPHCLCHVDFLGANFLVGKNDDISLIDWEYAGMGDYAIDFGTFCVCCQLDDEQIEFALEAYFGRTPTDEERRHNLAHIQLAGWCWYLWGLYMESVDSPIGEWLYIYYKYAQGFLDRTLKMYEEA